MNYEEYNKELEGSTLSRDQLDKALGQNNIEVSNSPKLSFDQYIEQLSQSKLSRDKFDALLKKMRIEYTVNKYDDYSYAIINGFRGSKSDFERQEETKYVSKILNGADKTAESLKKGILEVGARLTEVQTVQKELKGMPIEVLSLVKGEIDTIEAKQKDYNNKTIQNLGKKADKEHKHRANEIIGLETIVKGIEDKIEDRPTRDEVSEVLDKKFITKDNTYTKEETRKIVDNKFKKIVIPGNGGGSSGGGIQSVVAGTNITVDNTDPLNPVISATGGGGGGAVDSVNGETGVVVLNQDDILDGTTYKQYSATEKTKLAGIEAGAEVNNISDANATDLTDGGTTSLHNHDDIYTRTSSLGDLATLDTVDTIQIDNSAVTNAKLEQMNANTVKGRLSGNGTPQDIAMADLPISTATQTALDGKQATLGYTPENVANKATTMTGNIASNTLYLTAKAIYDWATGLFATITGTQTLTNKTIDLGSNTLTTTKAQLDTAVTDGDIAFTNQANVFTEQQVISGGGTGPTAGNGLHIRYDTISQKATLSGFHAGVDWRAMEYNGKSHSWLINDSQKMLLGADGSLTVNGQNRTSGWQSWTPTLTWSGGTTSPSTTSSDWSYKQIGKTVFVRGWFFGSGGNRTSLEITVPVAANNTVRTLLTNWMSSTGIDKMVFGRMFTGSINFSGFTLLGGNVELYVNFTYEAF